LTDIAVIIIAADDGIMPQTKEAIMHAKAAGVAMIIAINKIDLPGANVDQVKQQLQAEGLAPEDWGGDLICASVSAQTGEGVEHFLEMILLQAEMLELRANPHRRAKGYVIEGQMESGSGPTANLLITHGTLNVGDVMLCGRYWGRVRALLSDHGIKLKSAGPATPVKCLGLSGVPEAGAAFKICVNEKFARSTAQMEAEQAKDEQLTAPMKASLENLFEHMEESQKLELKIILKADTQGSIEAISHSLNEIKSDKVSLNIILGATGNITENDVMLASASSAVILGFHTAKVSGVDSLARHEGVEIRLHQIIYEIIDQVQNAMLGLLSIEYKENLVATADVKQVFTHGKVKKIAGCLVTSGTITPKLKARVKRNDEVLYEGKIASLKHFQDEVAEMKEAQECGVQLDGFSDLAEGDILEFYEMEELKKVL
ncbi:MAG: translation initiation factor IF-2, partial [Kiritimatiellae bacterium]|nr:translation initiation factor IF-2 [Kiritimatiellia bacterium]